MSLCEGVRAERYLVLAAKLFATVRERPVFSSRSILGLPGHFGGRGGRVPAFSRAMKRVASAMDPVTGSETLGDAARRARLDDGSNAAVELAIDSDDDATLGSDDLEDEIETDADAEEDSARAALPDGSDAKEPVAGVIPQEALIRRRLGRMKELNALYEDQYWRLLEDLRKRHYRFSLRHGHGGRKDDAAAETAAREKTGAAQLSECETQGCCERPMPLTTFCFAHILSDPKQVLYAAATKTRDASGDEASPIGPEPVLRTEEAVTVEDTNAEVKVANVMTKDDAKKTETPRAENAETAKPGDDAKNA